MIKAAKTVSMRTVVAAFDPSSDPVSVITMWLRGTATLLAIFTMPTFALAQGGSVGGTIGKQNKSVSGSEQASPSRREARKPTAQSNPAQDAKPSACGNFFGVWTSGGGAWLYGKNDTTFSANGTARHSSGIIGTWTCQGGEIVLIWKDWTDDRIKLSSDGRRLDSLAGGKGYSR